MVLKPRVLPEFAVGIVVGTRYIHTVTEMIEKSDLAAARDILVAYLATFE